MTRVLYRGTDACKTQTTFHDIRKTLFSNEENELKIYLNLARKRKEFFCSNLLESFYQTDRKLLNMFSPFSVNNLAS